MINDLRGTFTDPLFSIGPAISVIFFVVLKEIIGNMWIAGGLWLIGVLAALAIFELQKNARKTE